MATLNFAHREITAKVVYYGAPKAGTAASVRALWSGMTGVRRSELHAFGVGARTDHTSMFSYQLDTERVDLTGFTLRVCVFSLPGGVELDLHRREVMRDTDALIFVADARASRENANLDALLDAERALADVGIELASLPVVISVNHTDSPEAKEVANVVFDLNPYGYPVYPAVATAGIGVREAHEDVIATLLARLRENLSGHDAAVIVTAVHEPERETEAAIVARCLSAIAPESDTDLETSVEELPAVPESDDPSENFASGTLSPSNASEIDASKIDTTSVGRPASASANSDGSVANDRRAGPAMPDVGNGASADDDRRVNRPTTSSPAPAGRASPSTLPRHATANAQRDTPSGANTGVESAPDGLLARSASPNHDGHVEDVRVAYQPRAFAGARPVRVLGAELVDGQVHVDMLLERLDGGPHAHLRVVLDNQTHDTPAVPRAPSTMSITPTPGSATAHLPANIELEPPLEPLDLPGVWYGVAGMFGGLLVGLLLGFLVFG